MSNKRISSSATCSTSRKIWGIGESKCKRCQCYCSNTQTKIQESEWYLAPFFLMPNTILNRQVWGVDFTCLMHRCIFAKVFSVEKRLCLLPIPPAGEKRGHRHGAALDRWQSFCPLCGHPPGWHTLRLEQGTARQVFLWVGQRLVLYLINTNIHLLYLHSRCS